MTKLTALKSATLIVLATTSFLGAVHLFSVPESCECRARIPINFSRLSLIENSLSDASKIIVSTAGTLTLCYPKKPSQGHVDQSIGLLEETCHYTNTYSLGKQMDRKTATEAHIVYEIKERTISANPEAPVKLSSATALGKLYLNRHTNICTFETKDWNGEIASGEMTCAEKAFYFNPWSLFPQNVGLFYTRAFYATHKTN